MAIPQALHRDGCWRWGEPRSFWLILCVNWKQQNSISWCYFQLHITHEAVKSMANLPASHVVVYSQLFACPGEIQPFKDHSSTHDVWQASETSHNKSSLGNLYHWHLLEMLVTVYSHCVMVKSVPAVVYVEAKSSQIQSHMYVYIYIHLAML